MILYAGRGDLFVARNVPGSLSDDERIDVWAIRILQGLMVDHASSDWRAFR